MPTYEYKCTECNYAFELFQRMSDEPLKICPKCKGIVKRLIGSGAGTIFKGTGFYQTDYKNKSTSTASNKKEEKKDSKSGSKETKNSEGKNTK